MVGARLSRDVMGWVQAPLRCSGYDMGLIENKKVSIHSFKVSRKIPLGTLGIWEALISAFPYLFFVLSHTRVYTLYIYLGRYIDIHTCTLCLFSYLEQLTRICVAQGEESFDQLQLRNRSLSSHREKKRLGEPPLLSPYRFSLK